MTVTDDYLARCRDIITSIQSQSEVIQRVADRFTQTILSGRLVHVFGSGHSRIMVEEMWPRYGSFPGFHPMVELSLSFHHPVVGSNGQRQAMFIENTPGLADRILRNYDFSTLDAALVISSSGCNLVPIEIAEGFRERGIYVAALVSRLHCEGSRSQRPDGRKLPDFADDVLDTGAPLGDAMVQIPPLNTPVAPGSTIGGCMIVNCLKAEVARRLVDAGKPPRVLTSGALIGAQAATELFEAAYDEYGRRWSQLFAHLGAESNSQLPEIRPERPD
jgi:uncharacterized phosphosugar-binding protein